MIGIFTVLIVQYYIVFEDTFLYFFPVIISHSVQIIHNIIFFVIYAAFGKDQLGAYSYDIVSNIQFWFTLIITTSIALIPVILSRKVDNLFLNNIINNLRNGNFEEDCLKKIYTKKIEHMTRCTRSIIKFKKFLNDQRNYEPDNYVDKKMKDFVELYKNNRKSNVDKNHNQNLEVKMTEQLAETEIKNHYTDREYIRARSMDLKSNFFKTIQTINMKLKNRRRRSSFKEVKELYATDEAKVSNLKIDDENEMEEKQKNESPVNQPKLFKNNENKEP